MSRLRHSSIRITVSYEGSTVKVYAYDENSGQSFAEVITEKDPRRNNIEQVKRDVCATLKRGKREVSKSI